MKFGCNYWASNAGIEMWREWDENVVKEDMRRLHEAGNEILRVFPLWRDFQPIELARACSSRPREILMHNSHLPNTYCGQNGIDEVMLERFRKLIRFADAYGMKLIVPMITGWMSGRQYVPPAIENRNVFTDPLALKWQIKFVRAMVHELKNEPAIIMWELGNECNCLDRVADGDVAYNWTNTIISAIKIEDPSRPAGSGMHGLNAGNVSEYEYNSEWTLQTQGELCDFLTPHPYPHSCSKPPARLDVHTSFRNVHHAAIENQTYMDIGGKPSFVEEINTFSSGYCSEHVKALFMRNAMFNSWAHGSEYFLWWCAFEQKKLDFPPYDWCIWERELGEFKDDGTIREAAEYCRRFVEYRKSLPFQKLSPCHTDAVCLVAREMGYANFLTNTWSAFLMAKLAGFNIKYNYLNYEIPESPVYIMPGVRGLSSCYYSEYLKLLEHVKNGAVLYMSFDEGGTPTDVEKVLGCEFVSREARTAPVKFTFAGQQFMVSASHKLLLKPLDAEVLAAEEDGNPVFVHHKYGKGDIYFLAVPLEDFLGRKPGAFDKDAPDVSCIYRHIAAPVIAKRLVHYGDPYLTLTEHTDENGKLWYIAVNNSDDDLPASFTVASGWKITTVLPAQIPAHDGIVFALDKI